MFDEDELDHMRADWRAPPPGGYRGWAWLYNEHVLQADSGADLDVLRGGSGSTPPRYSH